jgi:hypothetical protein
MIALLLVPRRKQVRLDARYPERDREVDLQEISKPRFRALEAKPPFAAVRENPPANAAL